MRPKGLKTRIFLDSGDPVETKQVLKLLGFLDGQTTNPSLVAKNPQAKARLANGKKFSEAEVYDFYKQVVTEISTLIPDGSVSIEVYADQTTTPEKMLAQGREMFAWIPNAHVKYPITHAGQAAAEQTIKAGMRVNMTLCFSQAQAAAVYAATTGAKSGDVFISPFAGRLDDIGENGMTLVDNILKMYRDGDGHTEVLAASIRTMDHFMESLALGSDIITAPFAILEAWGKAAKPLPSADFSYKPELKAIPYQDINLDQPWLSYDIRHDLTDKGIEKFAADWNALIS